MELEDLLEEEVRSQLEGLKDIEMGTDEYKATVDGVVKLADRVIKIKELDYDASDKIDARETEVAIKKQQMKEEKNDRIIRNGIAIAGIVIPTAVTIWGRKEAGSRWDNILWHTMAVV